MGQKVLHKSMTDNSALIVFSIQIQILKKGGENHVIFPIESTVLTYGRGVGKAEYCKARIHSS
jgi:hypothetical protein